MEGNPPSFSEMIALMERAKMSGLREFARLLEVQPARSREETIKRVLPELKKIIRLVRIKQ